MPQLCVCGGTFFVGSPIIQQATRWVGTSSLLGHRAPQAGTEAGPTLAALAQNWHCAVSGTFHQLRGRSCEIKLLRTSHRKGRESQSRFSTHCADHIDDPSQGEQAGAVADSSLVTLNLEVLRRSGAQEGPRGCLPSPCLPAPHLR